MVGIDTDVLVRFLVQDDRAQFERARRLITREAGTAQPVFVSHLVLLETEWVLRSRYGIGKSSIADAFTFLLETTELQIEDEPTVEAAVYLWKESAADFADCMIAMRNRSVGCDSTASFDEKAAKLPTVRLI